MIPTAEQQRTQGARCGCGGADDMCPCQNVVQGSWFVERRIEWIRESIEIFGFLNREHVMKKFGVSMPQASLDLRAVQERWPQLVQYNRSAKRYEKVA